MKKKKFKNRHKMTVRDMLEDTPANEKRKFNWIRNSLYKAFKVYNNRDYKQRREYIKALRHGLETEPIEIEQYIPPEQKTKSGQLWINPQ